MVYNIGFLLFSSSDLKAVLEIHKSVNILQQLDQSDGDNAKVECFMIP